MTGKLFLRQLLYIALFLIAVVTLTMLWLRFYTNHGQKIEMTDYSDLPLETALEDAENKSFDIIVNDSIHQVGIEGGLIIDQNPKPGAMVKENRKVYVTITKFNPDKVKFGDLPTLYGNDFEQKRKELEHLEINAIVDDFKYDPGEPNHILEVKYNGQVIANRDIERKDIEIEKGGTLHFILSQRSGGKFTIPDLRCYTVKRARWFLEESYLKLGSITPTGIENLDDAYIISQSPSPNLAEKIEMGSSIDVVVSMEKPADCPD